MPASSSTALFIEPLDVLILRGNKLFADAGSHGEALMPPWPSVAAGALRSRMLIDAGIAGQPGRTALLDEKDVRGRQVPSVVADREDQVAEPFRSPVAKGNKYVDRHGDGVRVCRTGLGKPDPAQGLPNILSEGLHLTQAMGRAAGQESVDAQDHGARA